MRRSLRTRWDLLKPSISSRVCTRQNKMKEGHDQHAKMRVFEVGKSVVVRNFRGGEKWVPGVIVQQLGPLTYLIDVSQGRVWKRHVDHMKVYDRKPNEYDDSDSVVDDGMNESLSPLSTPELVPPTSPFCQAEVDRLLVQTPNYRSHQHPQGVHRLLFHWNRMLLGSQHRERLDLHRMLLGSPHQEHLLSPRMLLESSHTNL